MQKHQKTLLHSSIFHPVLRTWQGTQTITSENIMYPVFITNKGEDMEAITSMPGVYRYGERRVIKELKPLVEQGLKSVLLFGVVPDTEKDSKATNADSKENPVMQVIPLLRATFPDLIIACDVCLCPYTNHGHCGIFNLDKVIDNEASIKRISEIATAYARQGAHIVAPSDMMDGRILAIKESLVEAEICSRVSILSYSVKFASALYGPFRDAAQSSPSFGNRKQYQLPVTSTGMAARAAARDVEEGCDMLMVKPGMMYLDIVRQTKQAHPEMALFVYQVSGEYAMLYHAAKEGSFSLYDGVKESLIAFRRAGADCIITYFAPQILQWLREGKLCGEQ